jgi:D-ribose pyranose/furanose isomerase RbsD
MKDKYLDLAIHNVVKAFDEFIEVVAFEQDIELLIGLEEEIKQMALQYLDELETRD